MNRDAEDRIATAASRQHGVVTRGQLFEAGLSRCAIGRRMESKRLRLLHRGVYLALPFALPHTAEMAAVLASGPGALLSHLSAAALLALRAAVSGPINVIVLGNRGHRPGIRAHRVDRLDADERTERDRIPVTTAARTLLDLASVLRLRDLEAGLARAEREGLTTVEELTALLARHAGHPGTRALRAVLHLPGGPALTRSSAEAKLLALVREAGLATPECNVGLGPYEIDLLWRAAGLAVEVDGFRYHATRARFEGDRRKDAYLVASGITVLRLTWRQITEEPLKTVAQLAQALARAGNRK